MMRQSAAPSPRTRIRRLPDRARYDAATIAEIIDAAMLCTVAFQIDGSVHAIPITHWREGGHLYIHGAKASRMFKALTEGEACVTVALADGLVLARSALHHSMNYRSIVLYGRFEAVTDPVRKQESLQSFIDGLYPGRWDSLRPITRKEVDATAVLRIALDEAAAKVRNGGVKDEPADLDWRAWAGVIPLHTVIGEPAPARDSAVSKVPATRLG
ncbi:pyridoxamine 5'-phosphate oxidase family protein [Thauera sp. ZXT1-4]|jgi:hypothetical protein